MQRRRRAKGEGAKWVRPARSSGRRKANYEGTKRAGQASPSCFALCTLSFIIQPPTLDDRFGAKGQVADLAAMLVFSEAVAFFSRLAK